MREAKKFLVDEVAGHIKKSSYILLADFTKVTVADAAIVRNELRPLGAEYHVVKNSVFNIAAKQASLPDFTKHLTGHTAIVTGGDDAPGVAKVLVKFFKDKQKLEVKIGSMDGKTLSKADIEMLSKLPNLAGIRAQLLSLLNQPASSFARLLVAKNDLATGGSAPESTEGAAA
jgi:large subunit ribosomal protein L10